MGQGIRKVAALGTESKKVETLTQLQMSFFTLD